MLAAVLHACRLEMLSCCVAVCHVVFWCTGASHSAMAIQEFGVLLCLKTLFAQRPAKFLAFFVSIFMPMVSYSL